MRYKAQFGLCMPPETPQLRHTLQTKLLTTFSDQAYIGFNTNTLSIHAIVDKKGQLQSRPKYAESLNSR